MRMRAADGCGCGWRPLQVALGDFRHSRQEIEALSIVKMKELCRMYAKKDASERDSWRAVSQDVCDTVGIGEERSPPTEEAGGGEAGEGGERRNMYDLKAHIDKLTDILEVGVALLGGLQGAL